MNLFSLVLHITILGAAFVLHHFFDLTEVAFLLYGLYILIMISEIEGAVYKILEKTGGRR